MGNLEWDERGLTMFAVPTEPPKDVLYCHRDPEGRFSHFYPCEVAVRLCLFEHEKNGIVRVHDYKLNDYGMVYCDRRLLSMCFPYGIQVAEESGQGRAVRVRVELLEEVTS
jgi:hypothetical protein